MECSSSHYLSVAGASSGRGVCAGTEDHAGSHCREDCPQHLAWRVGSDDLEGMAAAGITQNPRSHQDFLGYM